MYVEPVEFLTLKPCGLIKFKLIEQDLTASIPYCQKDAILVLSFRHFNPSHLPKFCIFIKHLVDDLFESHMDDRNYFVSSTDHISLAFVSESSNVGKGATEDAFDILGDVF
jgi:hypothetical protein